MPYAEQAIDVSASGDTTLVAAHTGHYIRVHGVVCVSNGDTNVKFKSGSTSKTGPMALTPGGSLNWAPSATPWLTCGVEEGR